MRVSCKFFLPAAILCAASAAQAAYYTGPHSDTGTFNVYRTIVLGKTWDEARVAAAASNFNGTPGHLVTLHDLAENNFVNTIAPGSWWIGLTDSDATSTIDGFNSGATEQGGSRADWKWVTGEPYVFQNWNGGEPNDVGGEDAIQKSANIGDGGLGGGWNDLPSGSTLGQGNSALGYVIEYDTNLAAAPAVPPGGNLSGVIVNPQSQWKVTGYRNFSVPQITNYATSDALIGGSGLAAGFPVSQPFTFGDTFDNGNDAGNFAIGDQVPGLAPGVDHDDFAIVGTGALNVLASATYNFRTNTDDGSRLRISVNGGASQQVINDDVLSGPHNADSAGIALNVGDVVTFEWMWFERGGGAEGELSYTNDAFAANHTVVGDNTFGLDLAGGALNVATYKQDAAAAAIDLIRNPVNVAGTRIDPVMNILNLGDGSGPGVFGNDSQVPGMAGAEDNFMVEGTGFIYIPSDQTVQFASLTDDGSRLRIDGVDVIYDPTYHGNGTGDIKFGSAFLTAGYHPIEYLFFEAGGGASGELWIFDGTDPVALVGDVDNGGFLVTQQVPEPATIVLAGLGGLALLCLARRRRRSA